MRVLYHPEFPQDIQRFRDDYTRISINLGKRFHDEIEYSLAAIKAFPFRTGRFLQTESFIHHEFRRKNLKSFPFFVLYAASPEMIIFGAVVPSRSDPLSWLTRFA